MHTYKGYILILQQDIKNYVRFQFLQIFIGELRDIPM